jgi:hypothetical protein
MVCKAAVLTPSWSAGTPVVVSAADELDVDAAYVKDSEDNNIWDEEPELASGEGEVNVLALRLTVWIWGEDGRLEEGAVSTVTLPVKRAPGLVDGTSLGVKLGPPWGCSEAEVLTAMLVLEGTDSESIIVDWVVGEIEFAVTRTTEAVLLKGTPGTASAGKPWRGATWMSSYLV